ncbi:hypothetical protein [Crocosphaera sp. Alani8]|uniref:hypothetical protein n=1 Tax=Crocosphaera sp. Alani8 TaxID=3038952 RepID=UPI00313CC4A5
MVGSNYKREENLRKLLIYVDRKFNLFEVEVSDVYEFECYFRKGRPYYNLIIMINNMSERNSHQTYYLLNNYQNKIRKKQKYVPEIYIPIDIDYLGTSIKKQFKNEFSKNFFDLIVNGVEVEDFSFTAKCTLAQIIKD